MPSFKLYNCDVGLKINGVSYDFDHVQSVTIEDPEVTRVTRGSNGKNKKGLVYKEGLKEPKRISATIMDMSVDLKPVLDAAFQEETRVDFYVIDRASGSSKIAKDCVLSTQPQQLTLDDSPDSMNVVLMFESFNLSESFKE